MNGPIKRLNELLKESGATDAEAEAVVVRFRNMPSSDSQRLIYETTICLGESRFETFPGGFTTRLDRRPPNQGGDQLHITKRQGEKWAYRYDGSRSEPRKYTLPTTNAIRDIVSKKFVIPRSSIAEREAVGIDGATLIVEVAFR